MIECHHCRKMVERFEVVRDMRRMGYVVHAQCHGETDSCFVSDAFLIQWGRPDRAVAFQPPINPPYCPEAPGRHNG